MAEFSIDWDTPWEKTSYLPQFWKPCAWARSKTVVAGESYTIAVMVLYIRLSIVVQIDC